MSKNLPCPPIHEWCEVARSCPYKDPMAQCPYNLSKKHRRECCATTRCSYELPKILYKTLTKQGLTPDG